MRPDIQTNTQINRHTHYNTSQPYCGEVTNKLSLYTHMCWMFSWINFHIPMQIFKNHFRGLSFPKIEVVLDKIIKWNKIRHNSKHKEIIKQLQFTITIISWSWYRVEHSWQNVHPLPPVLSWTVIPDVVGIYAWQQISVYCDYAVQLTQSIHMHTDESLIK